MDYSNIFHWEKVITKIEIKVQIQYLFLFQTDQKTSECDHRLIVLMFGPSMSLKECLSPCLTLFYTLKKKFCVKVTEVSSDEHAQQFVNFVVQHSSRISSFDLTGTNRFDRSVLPNLTFFLMAWWQFLNLQFLKALKEKIDI